MRHRSNKGIISHAPIVQGIPDYVFEKSNIYFTHIIDFSNVLMELHCSSDKLFASAPGVTKPDLV
jgi:hypothetical protein